MKPLVSVIIPAYNADQFVAGAIRSVLGQTYPRIEVIVVDDGSTDCTAEVVASFGSAVRCLRQSNTGVSMARNKGANVAVGDYIGFLDADDEWLPRKIDVQVGRLTARPEAVASFTASVHVDERTGAEVTETCRVHPDMVEGLLLYSSIVGAGASSVLIRRDVASRVGGFDLDLSQCADWDMWIRLAELGPLDIVDEPLVRYRVHRANMSRNIRLLETDTMRTLRKFFDDPVHREHYGKRRRRIYGNHFMILSGSYLHAGALGSSLRCLGQGVVRHPHNAIRALGAPLRFVRRRLGRARAADRVRHASAG